MVVVPHRLTRAHGETMIEYTDRVLRDVKAYQDNILNPEVDILSAIEPTPREQLFGLDTLIEELTLRGELPPITECYVNDTEIIIY